MNFEELCRYGYGRVNDGVYDDVMIFADYEMLYDMALSMMMI